MAHRWGGVAQLLALLVRDPAAEALQELRRAAGTQFCPRCVSALERILPLESVVRDLPPVKPQVEPRLVRAS